MKDFTEQRIITAVRFLLTGRVNELLQSVEVHVPHIEFSDYKGKSIITPVISLTSCERTEKERIVRQDAYSLSITFTLSETQESEWNCYAYAGAVSRAVYDNPTLDGLVDRAVITGKKYKQPEKPNCGGDWQLVISMRVTVENLLPCRFST